MSKQTPSQESLEPSSQTTSIPNQFFSELLPEIDNLQELKLTLYAIWAYGHRESRFQYLRRTEMLEDDLLLSALKQPNLSVDESLEDAIERAVVRGTLVRATITFSHGSETFFFLTKTINHWNYA
jgi:hypothetical protein